ncbi:MAG: proprotein convertase P-domain-containing protein [Gemmataceae bacterium]
MKPFRTPFRLSCLELENRVVPAGPVSSSSFATMVQSVTSRFGDDIGFLFKDFSLWSMSHAQSQSLQPAFASPSPYSSPYLTSASSDYSLSPDQLNATLLQLHGTNVDMEVVSKTADTAPLIAQLKSQGVTVIDSYNRMVGVSVPIANLFAVSQLSNLNFGFAEYKPILNAGQVEDQAVTALRSDVSSVQYGVDGTGVTVGVLSDSFNNKATYSNDVASGDLPSNVNVLLDLGSNGTDEGRGMAQLVHDVAPGSPLAFYTAFAGESSFANGITKLAQPVSSGGAGAKVITDDVFYFHEPMFQDGIIAQSINNAVNTYGISEFSSAGNFARKAYQSAFNSTTAAVSVINSGASSTYHNFNPSGTADIYQSITIPTNATFTIDFQWDQPFASESTGAPGTAGSQNSVATYLLNSSKSSVVASSTNSAVGIDPYRTVSYTNTSSTSTQFYLVFRLTAGTAPTQMKYVMLGGGTIANYATNSGASFGHSNTTNAAGVAAAYFKSTPAYGVSPAAKESFTSAGGTAFYFDTDGNRLATPELRQQPRFTSADGSDTTFFASYNSNANGLYAFFGTSAAAPHAAAVAALMVQEVPTLTASQIYTILQNTAVPTTSNPSGGFNYDTGFGLIQADKALQAAAGISISGTVYRDYNNNASQDLNDPGLNGVTVFLDSNSNGTLDTSSNTTFTSTDVPVAIPDHSDPTTGFPSRVASTLTASGLAGRLTNITVKLSINHTFDSDLGVTLISPSGIRVPLFSEIGGTNGAGTNYVNTVLDSSAATSIQNATAPFTGTYRPLASLTALKGEDPNGVWQLEARDFWDGDTGTIQSWSITVSSADPSTTTNASGQYSFTGLPNSSYYGAYHVVQTVPNLLTQTSPSSPSNLTLGVGQPSTVNFGDYAPLSTVSSVTIDDGSAQRSMVRKIVVVVNGNVTAGNIQSGAFTLTQTSGPTATFTTNVFSVTALGGNQTAIELHFSGSSIIGGSLADGRYTLSIDGSKIADATGAPIDAAGTGTPGSVATRNLLRLYGDVNGDGFVNGADFFVFRQVYGAPSSDPAYLSYLDFQSDGFINGADYFQFAARYGSSI